MKTMKYKGKQTGKTDNKSVCFVVCISWIASKLTDNRQNALSKEIKAIIRSVVCLSVSLPLCQY